MTDQVVGITATAAPAKGPLAGRYAGGGGGEGGRRDHDDARRGEGGDVWRLAFAAATAKKSPVEKRPQIVWEFGVVFSRPKILLQQITALRGTEPWATNRSCEIFHSSS